MTMLKSRFMGLPLSLVYAPHAAAGMGPVEPQCSLERPVEPILYSPEAYRSALRQSIARKKYPGTLHVQARILHTARACPVSK